MLAPGDGMFTVADVLGTAASRPHSPLTRGGRETSGGCGASDDPMKGGNDSRHFEQSLTVTNRLRSEGRTTCSRHRWRLVCGGSLFRTMSA